MTGEERDAGRTENTYRVNAVMLIKAAIFGGDKGVDHFRRNLIERNGNTTFFAILRDKFAIRAVNLHRNLQTHIFQCRDVR
ncbi:Uncharacterised protein [Salmonella enterica subsp. enterica serovar Bovismorbificans]|nr:Uncharacterised protein [Salmonella enterica subsp. enterica serovar Bovismorbificans]